ncbi:MAG: hypothetical protein SNJ53_06970 [Thermodesulfovibrionales bacterium]
MKKSEILIAIAFVLSVTLSIFSCSKEKTGEHKTVMPSAIKSIINLYKVLGGEWTEVETP